MTGPVDSFRIDVAAISDEHTIVALSTAPGRGAIAVIRISGSGVHTLAKTLLDPAPTIARKATRCVVRDLGGETIDDAVATVFPAPHSFTGEDVLEISTHGGHAAPSRVLAAALHAGAREAGPGEFTRRAVLNGKLDLLQAEAISDLIDARSTAAHRQALRQLDGGLSRRIESLRGEILGLEALLAYDVDFPEEDDGPVPRGRITQAATDVRNALTQLLATGDQGTLVHEGALVVLAGAPNVGKSSLFNALLGEARAIVTEIPGTTRDAIEAVLDLPGWPLRLVDTAGLRETTDIVERLGIETSSRYLAQAAIVLLCVDSEAATDLHSQIQGCTSAPIITVATKGDVIPANARANADVVVSAYTGEGLASLLSAIETRLATDLGMPALDAPILTRTRHRVGVRQASDELELFLDAWRDNALPAVIAATHVRAAANALSELIGSVVVDDVLDAVFRRFCVGK